MNGDGTVDSGDMAVDQSGNPISGSLTVAGRVGIGRIAPRTKLHVQDVLTGADINSTDAHNK